MKNLDYLKKEDSVTASPIHMAQWVVDKMISQTSVHLQSLMYSQNLLPEELESIYIVNKLEQSAYSKIRNIAELYTEPDNISKLRYASYNVEHYLKAIAKHASRLISNKNIEIFVSCDSNCKTAVFDLRRMGLIIYNLLSNAVMHNKYKHKVIDIRASMRGEDFVISVRDNGRGIAPEKRKTMFSAYECLPSLNSNSVLSKNPFSISGLGLSVCKKAAKEMSGDIFYVPSRMGGTEFELVIPQAIHAKAFYDTILAEPDTDELEIYLAAAIISINFNSRL